MYAIILAGGVGTRLWPRSRENRPKQFSDITGSGLTMIQDTAERIARIRSSPEGREGVTSFLEKRRAAWLPPEPEVVEEEAPPEL